MFIDFIYRHTKAVFAFLLLIAFIIVSGPLYYSYKTSSEKATINEAEKYAKVIQSFRTLYTSEVIARLEDTPIEITHDYLQKEGAIPLPATLSIKLGQHISKDSTGHRVSLYSPYPFPWRTNNEYSSDDFSKRAWEALSKDKSKPFSEFQIINDRKIFRYATADIMRPACVHCHNTHPSSPKIDWETGDVRGILEVQQPIDPIESVFAAEQLKTGMVILGLVMLLLFTLAVILSKLKRSVALELEVTRRLEEVKQALDETAIVATTDVKGKITRVNNKFCEISKYNELELIGQDHRIINSGYHPKEFIADLWKTIANGDVWKGEIRNKAKDGNYYWVDTTIIPFLNEQGKPFQYIAIRFDITQRKSQEEEIIRQNKELDQFAYVVSHDLKSPLRAIQTLSQFIEEDLGEKLPEEVKKNFGILKGRVERMENLIFGILEYSKIGRRELEMTTIDLNSFLLEVMEMIVPPENLIILIQADLPVIRANRHEMHQVFQNLISNAIKYHDKDAGYVEVGHKIDASGIHLFWVKDDGSGIASEYHETIFGVFKILQSRDEVESTGIGLSIVKKIVEHNGGNIWVESEPDKGTTFFFTFRSIPEN